MRRTRKPADALMVLIFFICAVPAYAVLTPPDIAGTSTATPITGGLHDGWFLYEINIEWDLDGAGAGLSHWDLVLYVGCAPLDHLIEFDTPAGYSTTETEPANPEAMGWSGYFNRDGDPGGGITDPLLKYNNPFFPPDAQPGEQGYGTFSFIANIIPEYGTYENALVAKSGLPDPIYGDLVGAYPSCTIIPEPTALLLLAFGGLALLEKKQGLTEHRAFHFKSHILPLSRLSRRSRPKRFSTTSLLAEHLSELDNEQPRPLTDRQALVSSALAKPEGLPPSVCSA